MLRNVFMVFRSRFSRSYSSQQHAPRDFNPLTVDPSSAVRKQRRYERSNVFRDSDAPESSLAGDHLVEGGVVTHGNTAKVGLDRAGRDNVDSHASGPKLLSEIAGEHLDATLHRCIGGESRE